jgi:hypothetical protein
MCCRRAVRSGHHAFMITVWERKNRFRGAPFPNSDHDATPEANAADSRRQGPTPPPNSNRPPSDHQSHRANTLSNPNVSPCLMARQRSPRPPPTILTPVGCYCVQRALCSFQGVNSALRPLNALPSVCCGHRSWSIVAGGWALVGFGVALRLRDRLRRRVWRSGVVARAVDLRKCP